MNRRSKTGKSKKLLTIVGVCIILLLGAGTCAATLAAKTMVTKKSHEHFALDSKELTNTFIDNINHYTDILYSAHSFINSSQEVTQEEWNTFFKGQKIFERHPGLSTISYVEIVADKDKAAFLQKLRSQPEFGKNVAIHPVGPRPSYAVASLYSTENNIQDSLGFDLYSSDTRKAAFDQALAENAPTATSPLLLSSGVKGFLIVQPVWNGADQASGYAVASFRTSEFIQSLYDDKTFEDIGVQIMEINKTHQPTELFTSANWRNNAALFSRTDNVTVAGRTWRFSFQAVPTYDNEIVGKFMPRLVLFAGGVFMLLVASAFFILFKSVDELDA
jgi:CHASE1-domain containing sensor protein